MGRLVSIFARSLKPSSWDTSSQAKVPFNKLIGAFEKCTIASTRGQLMILQCALLLIMDPQSHRMDFPCPASGFSSISVKSLLSKDIREEAGHGAHSLDFHFPESEQSPLHGRRCCHRVFTVLCWRDMAEMHKIVGYRARLWGLSLLILLFDPFCRPVLSKCFN
jgi:hypothetical protein